MNMKKFLLTSLAVFVTYQILEFVIHNIVLSSDYEGLMSVWRPDMMDKIWIMYVTGAIFSLLFVYIFTKGQEGKGVMEGVKYGFIIGLLVSFVGAFNQYMVYPITYALTWKWTIYGLIELMILGAVTALIYKPEK